MPITSEHWLARLLLRAGPDIAVVAPEQWQVLAHATAQRVLARYASPPSP
jgi:predicted DNA-binding transcriptional regulator YafY